MSVEDTTSEMLCHLMEQRCRTSGRSSTLRLTRHAGAKLVGELGDEVIVYPVLHRPQDDHRSRVVDCKAESEDGSEELSGKYRDSLSLIHLYKSLFFRLSHRLNYYSHMAIISKYY